MDYFIKIKHSILPSFLKSNVLLYFVVFLLVLRIITILISVNIPPNIFFADITKSSLESFVNQTRQSLGLKTLSQNDKLNQAAQLKAENMVQNQYFNHNSPTGVTPWYWFLKAGYKYKYAGENLAVGFYESGEVYNAWLNSPSHKANIINPNYTEIGTAVLRGFGSPNTIVVVQEFGSPLQGETNLAKENVSNPVAPQPQDQNPVKTSETIVSSGQKVLSQAVDSNASNNLTSKLFGFVLYNYDEFLQNTIYGVSLVVIGVLIMLIYFNIGTNFKKELVFRSILIITLLSAAVLLDKDVIISLIPHKLII